MIRISPINSYSLITLSDVETLRSVYSRFHSDGVKAILLWQCAISHDYICFIRRHQYYEANDLAAEIMINWIYIAQQSPRIDVSTNRILSLFV